MVDAKTKEKIKQKIEEHVYYIESGLSGISGGFVSVDKLQAKKLKGNE